MDKQPFLLDNTIQHYAWGSRSAIASLQGRLPAQRPEAELWIGAHANASSLRRATGESLFQLISDDPASALGHRTRTAFGDSLPFLLKVLAAGSPLSLQAHPSREQAVAGFDAEERAGISMSDPKRVFKDRNHKPELICALTDFEALCGFRPVQQTAALLDALRTPTTAGMAARIRSEHPGVALRTIVVDLLEANRTRAQQVIDEIVPICQKHSGTWGAEAQLTVRLAAAYPGDIGAIIALLLNRVVLSPGDALMLPAGNLHAYIQGVGVELMANSDNVLRGGLTPKHVDVPGLIQVVDWNPLHGPAIRPSPVPDANGQPGVVRYPSPSDEFRLDAITLTVDAGVTLAVEGPELLWCHTGSAQIGVTGTQPLTVTAGDAVFVPAAARRYTLGGSGSVFRSTIGL